MLRMEWTTIRDLPVSRLRRTSWDNKVLGE